MTEKEQEKDDMVFHENDYEDELYADKEKLKKLVNTYRNKSNNNWDKQSNRELEVALGIGKEMFDRRLYGDKPTEQRDFILAICILLRMTVADTSRALAYYHNMPILNEKDPRDKRIMEILQETTIENLDEANEYLENRHFEKIKINNRKRKAIKGSSEKKHTVKRDAINQEAKSKNEKGIYPYKLLGKKSSTYAGDLYYGDQYRSLSTAYDFNRYSCSAYMHLIDEESGKKYILNAGEGNSFWLRTMSITDSSVDFYQQFKTADESGEFRDCFLELQDMVKSEQKCMDGYLNDTRNYEGRIGAGILDDRIHIFFEKYNYSVPELNEYYMMEYIEGVYRLSVSHTSCFMTKYLTEEIYKEHYNALPSEPFETFESVEEIDEQLKNEKTTNTRTYVLRMRRNAYKLLKVSVDKCLEQLRKKEIFVNNLAQIWDDPDRVCWFYKVENEFQCTTDEMGDLIFAGVEQAVLCDNEGNETIITLEELKRSFELGLKSIADICRVKRNLGSIEEVLR